MAPEKSLQPLLQKVAPPFLLESKVYDTLAETPLLDEDIALKPYWTFARQKKNGYKFPQTIAHRGYRAKHPENTMDAFVGAVKAGAHAIETDIHLSKDGVVVISHDATLKRCYGKENKIIDCNWDFLSQQRTLKEPHVPMPRLKDVLEYLASPGLENIWLLLDIKIDNDADDVMRLIASTIEQTAPNPHKSWNHRIVLGCWAAKYIPLCATYLPSFPITHIGFSLSYARQFFAIPNVSFNLLQKMLVGPLGVRFLRDAAALGRPVIGWTVNEENMMRWSIKHELDGVITDDPKRFLEVCDEWEQGKRKIVIGRKELFLILWLNMMVVIFGAIFRWKYPFRGGIGYKRGRRSEKR